MNAYYIYLPPFPICSIHFKSSMQWDLMKATISSNHNCTVFDSMTALKYRAFCSFSKWWKSSQVMPLSMTFEKWPIHIYFWRHDLLVWFQVPDLQSALSGKSCSDGWPTEQEIMVRFDCITFIIQIKLFQIVDTHWSFERLVSLVCLQRISYPQKWVKHENESYE